MDWSLLGFKGLGEVLNIHPVFVHFPVALFPTTLLFYFVGIVWCKEKFIFAGRVSLILAFLASALTVLTGELAAGSFPHNETIHRIMETHEQIGIFILVSGFLLSVWSFFQTDGVPKWRGIFLLALFLSALAVLQNADLGGRMVFVEGAGVKNDGMDHHHGDHDHSHHHPGGKI